MSTDVEDRRGVDDLRAVDHEDWMDQGMCRGRTTWFFAPPGERQRDRRAREYVARFICAQCPVMTECRDFARRWGEWGFWGGESEHERIAAGYPPSLAASPAPRRLPGEGGLVLVNEG